jgi:hypothetical protein
MDPTIAAALIGVGGVVVGVGAASWSSHVTLRVSRETARNDRLWEKTSALYEQLLGPTTVVDSEHLDAVFDSLKRLRTPVWAYASDAVLHQYWVTLAALQDVERPMGVEEEVRQVIKAMEETHRLTRRVRNALQETRLPGPLWRLRHPRRWRNVAGLPPARRTLKRGR